MQAPHAKRLAKRIPFARTRQPRRLACSLHARDAPARPAGPGAPQEAVRRGLVRASVDERAADTLEPALHGLARAGAPADLRVLLLARADVEARDQRQETALVAAAAAARWAAVRALLRCRAAPDVPARETGRTALHLAVGLSSPPPLPSPPARRPPVPIACCVACFLPSPVCTVCAGGWSIWAAAAAHPGERGAVELRRSGRRGRSHAGPVVSGSQ